MPFTIYLISATSLSCLTQHKVLLQLIHLKLCFDVQPMKNHVLEWALTIIKYALLKMIILEALCVLGAVHRDECTIFKF